MDKEKLIELRQSGLTYKAIANLFGVSRQCIHQKIGKVASDTSGSRVLSPLSQNWRKRLSLAIIERDNHRCKLCGSLESLIVHHIDGNCFNNDPLNMLTLCKQCHGQSHVKHNRDNVNKNLNGLIS